jgi:SAM-dependent methyltransferase
MDSVGRFQALCRAAHDEHDAAAGLELAWMLSHMRPDRPHPEIDRAWESAFEGPWDLPARLAPAALDYLAMHPAVSGALASQDDLEALQRATMQLAGSRLFQLVASRALITPAAWQSLLLRWRALAWRRHRAGGSAPTGLAWIALQANLAEYVWPADVEEPEVAALRDEVSRDDARADAAILLACCEHPGGDAQFALDDADPAQKLLLERLYREPAQEHSIASGLVADAAQALSQVAQRDQYERYPYPRWIAEPMLANAIPHAASAHMKTNWLRRRKVLLAGCGTGQQCLAARATYPDAAITAIDFSVTSLAYAVRKCREAGLKGIAFEVADLLAYPKRGLQFDLVECIGVLHHLTDLDAGAAALRALTRTGGLLRLAVYSAAARQSVRDVRATIAARGLDGSLASLRRVRAELIEGRHGAMSAAMLESPDLHSASGVHDLLFNACEHSLGAVAWTELLTRHGFELVCMDPPQATLVAAGAGSSLWGPREWEACEREHPDAFASMYVFWFAAARAA